MELLTVKTKKTHNIIMIVFFLAAITAPLIFVNWVPNKISTAENKELANFPNIVQSDGKLNIQFPADFTSWFNDNLGFRDDLVEANSLLQYDIFGNLTKSDTIVGKNNWLYYVTPDIIKDYQNLDLPTQQQLAGWSNSLVKVNNYLKSNNIPYIYNLDLDKKTIYPENYPSSILKVGNVSSTNMFLDYLRSNTGLDFFTPESQLLAAKSSEQVYYQNEDNAHWNANGIFIGYQQLMSHVKTYFPNIKVLSKDDFKITTQKVETKVYNSVPFYENDSIYTYKYPATAVETFGDLDTLNLTYPWLNYTYENIDNKNLPTVLVFGDSYTDNWMLPYFAQSFSKVIFVHTENIDRLQYLVDIYHPNLVIFEEVERMFDHTMGVLANTKEPLTDYSTYANLPVKQNPTMTINYCDNQIPKSQNTILYNADLKYVNIIGWAIDSKAGSDASSVYLKVGDKYYSAYYGQQRTDVSGYFHNPNVVNSGFTFNINTSDLKEAGKCSLIIISKDKKYQYAPIEIQAIPV
jgi:alginate O-acetyltransferase complex protein AlgJ